MSLLLFPRSLREVAAALRPGAGLRSAAAGARSAERSAAERRAVALDQARAAGPQSWTPLHARCGTEGAHGVDLHASEAAQLTRLTAYVLDGLDAGDTVLVVVTASHAAGLRQRLRIIGVDPAPERLVVLDADRTLAALLRDGRPDPERYDAVVGEAVRALAAGPRPLRAYGEMVGLLGAAGRLDAALELEVLWERLQAETPFLLLCAYPAPADDVARESLRRAAHRHHTHEVSVAG